MRSAFTNLRVKLNNWIHALVELFVIVTSNARTCLVRVCVLNPAVIDRLLCASSQLHKSFCTRTPFNANESFLWVGNDAGIAHITQQTTTPWKCVVTKRERIEKFERRKKKRNRAVYFLVGNCMRFLCVAALHIEESFLFYCPNWCEWKIERRWNIRLSPWLCHLEEEKNHQLILAIGMQHTSYTSRTFILRSLSLSHTLPVSLFESSSALSLKLSLSLSPPDSVFYCLSCLSLSLYPSTAYLSSCFCLGFCLPFYLSLLCLSTPSLFLPSLAQLRARTRCFSVLIGIT